jgi:tight adherence protein B
MQTVIRSGTTMLDADFSEILIWALVALSVSAVIFAVLYPRLMGENTSERIEAVTASRTKKVATRNAADVTANRKKAVTDTLKDIENRKKKSTEKASLRARLMQAGLELDVRGYWISSAISGVVCGVATYVFSPASIAGIAPMLAIIATAAGTFGLPGWVLNYLIKRRQVKFVSNLANAIDIVVRGVKTGLPLNECLGIIARESPEPLASEFKEVVDQQRMGVTLGDALDRLVTRMPLPEVKFLAIVISIQQSAGGNLSEALGNLSQVLRDRFSLKLKVKALSAEALASAMVLGSLPPLVIIMIQVSTPTYLEPLYTTNTGNMLTVFGLFWMFVGVMTMRKMINFKY